MPPRARHLEFDDLLRFKGIICDDTDGNSVHARLDRGSRKYAEAHREKDPFHSTDGIRIYIDNIVNSIRNIYQGTATDYIRIAWGHVCLDYIASKMKEVYECTYDELDWEDVFKRTWRLYKRYGLHKTYYKQKIAN